MTTETVKYIRDRDECFYCGTTAWAAGGLEEHHLWRGKDRLLSPSVYICRKCHQRATDDYNFAKKLQKIYLYQYEQFKFKPGTIAGYGADKFNPKNYGSNERNAVGCSDTGPSQRLDESIEQ